MISYRTLDIDGLWNKIDSREIVVQWFKQSTGQGSIDRKYGFYRTGKIQRIK